MLYGYPAESIAENWFHDCLETVLRKMHHNLDAGIPVEAWPDCIPIEHKATLKSRHGLKSRLKEYANALSSLSQGDRAVVYDALISQNNIEALLSGAHACAALSSLPQAIQRPLKDLFEFSFSLLTELGIRDRHYRLIWDSRPQHYCPFCGLEFFSAPGEPREDQDHFLAESIYPFAAVNLKNLVPMGTKCNQRYKLSKNVLIDEKGVRRRVFYAYNHQGISVNLDRSEPFPSLDQRTPRWVIDLVPSSEEAESWDSVFDIRRRYENDVLNPQFVEWLRHLKAWWIGEMPSGPVTDPTLISGLAKYIQHLSNMGMSGRDFLRVPMFEMLHKHCQSGHTRLINFLRTAVST